MLEMCSIPMVRITILTSHFLKVNHLDSGGIVAQLQRISISNLFPKQFFSYAVGEEHLLVGEVEEFACL